MHRLITYFFPSAGYPHQPEKYQHRFEGLILNLQQEDPEIRKKFYVIGGECNYCFQSTDSGTLQELPDEAWKSPELM
jgi:exonuclease III